MIRDLGIRCSRESCRSSAVESHICQNRADMGHPSFVTRPNAIAVVGLWTRLVQAACGRTYGAAAWPRLLTRALVLLPPPPAPRPALEYRRCCLGFRRD